MIRREFITLVGGAAATARAQQPAMLVIGVLGSASPDAWAGGLLAFRDPDRPSAGSSHIWLQRTNVWRQITSPARGVKLRMSVKG
jgi:hypothetical protein